MSEQTLKYMARVELEGAHIRTKGPLLLSTSTLILSLLLPEHAN
jgi:hypothetical protein